MAMGAVAVPGEATASERHVAIVILTYNSDGDLMLSAPQLAAQKGVRISLIIVDNASSPESVARIERWLKEWRPDAVVGRPAEVSEEIQSGFPVAQGSVPVFFVVNGENRGYSAGNNVGIRLADALGADAVLIANPDMRIVDPEYVATLADHLFLNDRHFVVGSKILGLDGIDQNPLREAGFLEEFLWPLQLLRRRGGGSSYLLAVSGDGPSSVPKLSGCCLMIRMSFLRATDLLDERVFLYCEEPILAARVRRHGGVILYVPSVCATHAHVSSEKGDPAARMRLFIRSRLYYLRSYSGYRGWRLRALRCSYRLLAFAHGVRRLRPR